MHSQSHTAGEQSSPLTGTLRPANNQMSPEYSTKAVPSEGPDLSSPKKPQLFCLKPDISSFSLFSLLLVLFFVVECWFRILSAS